MPIHQGSKLKWFVERQSLTNEQLAEKWGISKPTLQRWFNLEHLNSKKLIEICRVMGWDFEREFLGISGNSGKGQQLTHEQQIEILRMERDNLMEQVRQLKEINDLLRTNEYFKKKRKQ